MRMGLEIEEMLAPHLREKMEEVDKKGKKEDTK